MSSNQTAALRLLLFFGAFIGAAFFVPTMANLLVFMAIIGFMVFIHELGHYIWFRRAGVVVRAFSIGMGPPIATFTRKNGERWIFALLPVGGYVLPQGSEMHAPGGAIVRPGDYASATPAGRLKAVLAGPLVNIVFGLGLLTAILMWPVPEYGTQISSVQENSPAAALSIRPGDEIVAVNGTPVNRLSELIPALRAAASQNQAITLTLQQGETLRQVSVHLQEGQKLGMIFSDEPIGQRVRYTPWGAAAESVRLSVDITVQTFISLKEIFSNVDKIAGPAEFGQIVSDNHQQNGLKQSLFLLAVLSIILGVFNLIPLLPLDGGHAVNILAEMAGRPIPLQVQKAITALVAIPLVALTFVWLFWDVIKPFVI